jgi:hypothetical protein
VIRTVVVELWTGALVVQRLGPDDPDPTLAELDAIAVAHIAANDGVRPVVRVMEQMPSLRSRGTRYDHGPAGAVPRG